MPEKPKDYACAEAKALSLLACRERSAGELQRRLMQNGFSEAICAELIKRFQACALVDDQRFCRLYVESKRRQGWGTLRIMHELKRFDIEAVDYPELFAFDADAEEDENARAMLTLEHYHGRSKDAYAGRFRYLKAKGFSASVIARALRSWQSQEATSG